jgi:hypothetical protein
VFGFVGGTYSEEFELPIIENSVEATNRQSDRMGDEKMSCLLSKEVEKGKKERVVVCTYLIIKPVHARLC